MSAGPLLTLASWVTIVRRQTGWHELFDMDQLELYYENTCVR